MENGAVCAATRTAKTGCWVASAVYHQCCCSCSSSSSSTAVVQACWHVQLVVACCVVWLLWSLSTELPLRWDTLLLDHVASARVSWQGIALWSILLAYAVAHLLTARWWLNVCVFYNDTSANKPVVQGFHCAMYIAGDNVTSNDGWLWFLCCDLRRAWPPIQCCYF
jgi:hypothetical protein